ncbi:carboxylesterase family protein [Streptomyces lavendulae]|uniref:carboxylesterase family protein n=1 Tax=Streptomyces lavendulae TaxID=1914 RepID=UPI0036B4C3AC
MEFRIDRRRLLAGVAALGAVWPSRGGGGLVVPTSSGAFRGRACGGVTRWLGIPYASAPVGELRFAAPRPVRPARTIVEADRFGPASLQTIASVVSWIYPPLSPEEQSEDCLTLNVWAANRDEALPVIVWLHGGGYRTGATRMPLMDGHALASHGCVVVTVNYRLGALGLLSHPDFTDAFNSTSANWSLQDMGAALAWVRLNIAAFGGDPMKICVVGQSGGAQHAAVLAQSPLYWPLLRSVVLLSPPSVRVPQAPTMEDAAAYTELLATGLGTTVKGLRKLPARMVHEAELALSAKPLPPSFTSGFLYRIAILNDNRSCMGEWTQRDWPADVPVLITFTHDEGAFFLDLYDPISGRMLTPSLPGSDAALVSAVRSAVGGSAQVAATVIDAYRCAALAEGRSSAPGDLWIDIFADPMRYRGTRYAAVLAAAGVQVRYGTHMHAVKAPGRGVPHCAELPLLFGTQTLDYYRDKIGGGPVEAELSDRLMRSLISFARDAQPQLACGAPWPLYQPGTATCVRWGGRGSSNEVLGPVPKVSQLTVWDGILGA